MSEPAPSLAPLFRSTNQMLLLSEIFYGAPASGAELARRTGIPQPTVARELTRLEAAGIVRTEQIGTAKVVSVADDLPYAGALRQLLGYVGGAIPALAAAYESNHEIDEVFIFGSWARRFQGEPGPAPNDIDVAMVSDTATRLDLAAARMELEAKLGLNVDQFVFPADSERVRELRKDSVLVFRRQR